MAEQGAPDDDERRGPFVVLRILKRWRALLVLVPLGAGLAVAAAIGARMLWAEVPERAGPGPDVTCWDTSVAPAAQCPVPSGVAGLRWVFPSFTPALPECVEVGRKEQEPLEWRCRVVLDGKPVRVTYGARASTEQALRGLRKRYGVEPESFAAGERLVFRIPERTAEGYVLAVAYARYPFVATVAAATIGLRERALKQVVQFRPEAKVVVRR